eukprot:11174071-Lingulodinium_polyedra.AAC.1
MEHHTDTEFVTRWLHWDTVGVTGRFVTLDQQSRVVYAQPSERVNVQADLQSGALRYLVHNTGIRMVKATAAF